MIDNVCVQLLSCGPYAYLVLLCDWFICFFIHSNQSQSNFLADQMLCLIVYLFLWLLTSMKGICFYRCSFTSMNEDVCMDLPPLQTRYWVSLLVGVCIYRFTFLADHICWICFLLLLFVSLFIHFIERRCTWQIYLSCRPDIEFVCLLHLFAWLFIHFIEITFLADQMLS